MDLFGAAINWPCSCLVATVALLDDIRSEGPKTSGSREDHCCGVGSKVLELRK